MDFLERIRQKPPIVRAQYALGIAALVTSIIAVVWLSTLPARFANVGDFSDIASSTVPVTGMQDLFPQEQEPAPEIVAPSLGALDLTATSVPAATLATSAVPSTTSAEATTTATPVPRVIQIGTTSPSGQ